jgi:hypothetical protein
MAVLSLDRRGGREKNVFLIDQIFAVYDPLQDQK